VSKRAMLAALLLCVGASLAAPPAHASLLNLDRTGLSAHASPQGGPQQSFIDRLRQLLFNFLD